MSPVRVLVADGHAVAREGLKAIARARPGLRVVGEACDGPTALPLAAELDPDVVVVEVALAGLDGAEVAALLRAERSDRKVMALTACEDAAVVRRVLAAGARGYVLKQTTAEQLAQAVLTVADGGTYLDPKVAGDVVGDVFNPSAGSKARGVELSERECAAVRLVALGYSNKEIAARLKVSVKTVETYKTRAMEKLAAKSRVDLVRYAVGRGWLAEAGPITDTPAGRAAPPPVPALSRV